MRHPSFPIACLICFIVLGHCSQQDQAEQPKHPPQRQVAAPTNTPPTPVRAVWAGDEVVPQNSLFFVETREGVSVYIRPKKAQAGFYVGVAYCPEVTISQLLSNPDMECYRTALRMRDQIVTHPDYAFTGGITTVDNTLPHADLGTLPKTQVHADLGSLPRKLPPTGQGKPPLTAPKP